MLILAVLSLLGVPLWLLVGAVGAAYWNRRRFLQSPGVFACRVREVPAGDALPAWPRVASHARWVHDVLLVHSGLSLRAFVAIGVAALERPIEQAEGTRFEDSAFSIRVRLDDGRMVELAARDADQTLLAGPFGDGSTGQLAVGRGLDPQRT